MKDKLDTAPRTVLVVNDDEAHRLMLIEAVKERGYRPLEADSGERVCLAATVVVRDPRRTLVPRPVRRLRAVVRRLLGRRIRPTELVTKKAESGSRKKRGGRIEVEET